MLWRAPEAERELPPEQSCHVAAGRLRRECGEQRSHLIVNVGGFRERRNELGLHMMPEPVAHSAQRLSKTAGVLSESCRDCGKLPMLALAADQWLEHLELIALACITPLNGKRVGREPQDVESPFPVELAIGRQSARIAQLQSGGSIGSRLQRDHRCTTAAFLAK